MNNIRSSFIYYMKSEFSQNSLPEIATFNRASENCEGAQGQVQKQMVFVKEYNAYVCIIFELLLIYLVISPYTKNDKLMASV